MFAATARTSLETRSRSAAASPARGSSSSSTCGLDAEGDTQVHQALSAVGEIAAPDLLYAFETEEPYQFRGFRVNFRVAVDVAPQVEAGRIARLHRQPEVLVDRQAAEQIGDLKRTRQALPADAVRRQAVDLPAVKPYGALIGAYRPDIRLNNVVFPAPFGPISA